MPPPLDLCRVVLGELENHVLLFLPKGRPGGRPPGSRIWERPPGGEQVSSRPLGSVSPSVIVAKAGAVFSGLTTRRALL